MKHLVASFALILASPALADGGVSVRLPDDGALAAAASPAFLAQLVTANVVGMNCPGVSLSDGEWALLTGSADKVAAALGLSTGAYDDQFYGPAFAALDDPATCSAKAPLIAPLIQRLKSMGGSTQPIN
ncbi:MAG: hypothetical protein WAT09_15815 [Paracoccaceae bacterium]